MTYRLQIELEGEIRIIYWEVLKIVYENGKAIPELRFLLDHLKDEHIYYDRCPQMRVKHAVQVFSNSTYKELETAASLVGK